MSDYFAVILRGSDSRGVWWESFWREGHFTATRHRAGNLAQLERHYKTGMHASGAAIDRASRGVVAAGEKPWCPAYDQPYNSHIDLCKHVVMAY